jgi:hypothetical protein
MSRVKASRSESVWQQQLESASVPFDENPGVTTLVLVGGFLVGVVLSALTGWWRERVKRRHRAVEDAQAVGALAAGVLLIALTWNRLHPVVPPDRISAALGHWAHLGRLGPENLLAAVVGFYFGSRS